ncbi:MAG: hypothetical protein HY279_05090 [Nitrospinae bacterium]|nr:hypothetical protein [Nitrospinota bacterium]
MRQESHIWKDKEGKTGTVDRIRTSIEAYKFIRRLRKAIKKQYGKKPIR